jgi:anti-anti-sigma regulatory factor
VLVNLTHGRMLGGDAMEILLEAGAEARRSGGALRLLHADKAAARLLIYTRLITAFDMFETEEEALASSQRVST